MFLGDCLVEKLILLLDAASTLLTSEAFFIHLLHRLYVSTRVSIFSRREALNLVDIGLSLSFYGAAALSIYAESPDFGQISGNYTCNIHSINYLTVISSKTIKIK